MTISADSILQIRDEYPDLDSVVWNLLLECGEEGVTIEEIKDKYYEVVGAKFPISGDFSNIICYLLSIPFVSVYCSQQGTLIFTLKTDMTSRALNLWQQKRNQQNNNWPSDSRPYVRQSQRNNVPKVRTHFTRPTQHHVVNELEGQEEFHYGVPDNYFGDWIYNNHGNNLINNDNNYVKADFSKLNRLLTEINENLRRQTLSSQSTRSQSRRSRRTRSSRTTCTRSRRTRSSRTTCTRARKSVNSAYSSNGHDQAKLWGIPLLGDDFLLYLARREFMCKLTKKNGVLQSGLCVSGQTISDAIQRVHQMKNYRVRTEVLVNIGSVDIMLGKPLVQIEYQFRELINLMHRKGMIPILTTLAPLANFAHVPEVKYKLEKFNSYIKWIGRNFQVIDIWSGVVHGEGRTLFECYQKEPHYVTGTSVPHLLWSYTGRQNILHLITKSVAH